MYISNCKIPANELGTFKNLMLLILESNQIQYISSLKNLPSLSYIQLINEKIKDLSVLKDLPNLDYVYFERMIISDLKTINALKDKGVEVDFGRGVFFDRPVEPEKVKQVFKEEDGFKVSNDGKTISIDLSEEEKDVITLSSEQVEVLTNSEQKLEIVKGDVSLNIPVSVFEDENEPVNIKITKLDDTPGSVSSTYDFTIEQDGNTISMFNNEITLIFEVNLELVDNPANLRVHYFDEEENDWINIGGTFRDGKVVVTTDHFSMFTVFEIEPSLEDDSDDPKQNENSSSDEGTENDQSNEGTENNDEENVKGSETEQKDKEVNKAADEENYRY